MFYQLNRTATPLYTSTNISYISNSQFTHTTMPHEIHTSIVKQSAVAIGYFTFLNIILHFIIKLWQTMLNKKHATISSDIMQKTKEQPLFNLLQLMYNVIYQLNFKLKNFIPHTVASCKVSGPSHVLHTTAMTKKFQRETVQNPIRSRLIS